jgi:hypothetical protein
MRIKIPLQIIELESENYHILGSSVFADGQKANWIIDTGASKTVFDKNLTDYYTTLDGESDEIHTATPSENALDVVLAELKPFSFGKIEVDKQKVALLDLSHINELYSAYTENKIYGLIGSDFLMKYQARIDYKKQVLILIE